MHQSVIHLSQVGTYFRIDFCYNLSMVVSHCRILSPDKTEWRLISAILCGWRHCFVADQLWLMTCIREEEEWLPVWLSGSTLVSIIKVDVSHVRLVLEHSWQVAFLWDNLTFVKCPCSVFNAKCHYNLYFFNNNSDSRFESIRRFVLGKSIRIDSFC